MLSELEISDKIQVIAIIVSTSVALISIFIAIATLIQTSKVTKEANRPYVVIYLEAIQVSSIPNYFLVVKNFGNTGAVIDSISYKPNFEIKLGSMPFASLNQHFIAPRQSITTACCFKKPYKVINFEINYHQGKKYYSDSFTINPESVSSLNFLKTAPSDSSNLEKIISYSTQEIIRTKL